MYRTYLSLGMVILLPTLLPAADLYVNVDTGNDAGPATRDAPVSTAQRAVNLAQPGDTIHLLPRGAVCRQSILLRGKSQLVIEGNGVTLEGADPLPQDGWEDLGDQLWRRQLPRTVSDRHLLIMAGRTERMGRTQMSDAPDFPAAKDLIIGQFCFEPVNDKVGWLYVRGDTQGLQWAVRANGVATRDENSHITVRNLNARHFLNDGFNVHGDAVHMRFQNIQGYDCFDEGFSAHEKCACEIEDARFWGNDNAVADVDDCRTDYRRCEFRGSVHYDVQLVGAGHSLTDCRIVNTTTAMPLSAGPRRTTGNSYELLLDRVEIRCNRPGVIASARFSGGTVRLRDCRFINVNLSTTGASVINERSQILSE